MGPTRAAPYGSWRSPITSDLIVAGTVSLGEIALDGEDIYWTETRPTEGGRTVLVRLTPGGVMADLTPSPYSVRSRVHEYGGGAYAIYDGTVFFSNLADQEVYRQAPGGAPEALTAAPGMRYADFAFDRARGRLYCVREDHSSPGKEPTNTLVALNTGGDAEACRGGRVLASGNDFYSSPRLSPDGTHLAWLAWDHPNMPWDGTELWIGELTVGGIVNPRLVAGGAGESVFQPEWGPDGTVYFVSDRTGWWNLYRWRDGHSGPLLPMEAEFGLPQWVFGMSTYAFESAGRLVCAYTREGVWRLAAVDLTTLDYRDIETPYTGVTGLAARSGEVLFLGGSPSEPTSVVSVTPDTGRTRILRRSSRVEIDPGYLSTPEAVSYPTEAGEIAHAIFYPPKNRDYRAPTGERPPVLVLSHGGPTGSTSTTLNPGLQYWTSRGIAVLDVNYGGSTGYGRAYRERLRGRWGVADVDDCVAAVRYMARRGDVDGDRAAIAGVSAGGYTTLAALTFRNAFRAGASHFGVSDLESLARETHKFESRYLDSLVGPYPETRDTYRERSPINYAERLSCPVIFFQGLEDKVVPPNQAELMFKKLRGKGVPVAYVAFEGEGHGFLRAENIRKARDAQLYFFSRVFGFDPGPEAEEVPIENLEGPSGR